MNELVIMNRKQNIGDTITIQEKVISFLIVLCVTILLTKLSVDLRSDNEPLRSYAFADSCFFTDFRFLDFPLTMPKEIKKATTKSVYNQKGETFPFGILSTS